ncbi:MAG: hypothetical protein WEA31_07125, partial [Pirellulales bacterium]
PNITNIIGRWSAGNCLPELGWRSYNTCMTQLPQNYSAADLFLDPLVSAFTPEMADRISKLELAQPSDDRLEILREKANEGRLSDTEREEYEAFIEALDWLAILRLKARARAAAGE